MAERQRKSFLSLALRVGLWCLPLIAGVVFWAVQPGAIPDGDDVGVGGVGGAGIGVPRQDAGPMAWFLDLNTHELFVRPASVTPPTAAPSGPIPTDGRPAGAGAYVFGCGGCNEPEDRQVGYLYRHLLDHPPAGPLDEAATLVRRPGDHAWHLRQSDEGQTIVREAHEVCGPDEPAVPCPAE